MNVIVSLRDSIANKKAKNLQNKVDGDIDYYQPIKIAEYLTGLFITLVILLLIALGLGYLTNTKPTTTPAYHNVYESYLYVEDSHNRVHLNYDNTAIDNAPTARILAKNKAFSGAGYLLFKIKKEFGATPVKNTQKDINTIQNPYVKDDAYHQYIGRFWFN